MTIFLVGVDGSEGARRAALFAARRARAENARLLLVHIVESTHYPMMLPEEFPPQLVGQHEESESALQYVLQPVKDAVKEAVEAEDLEIELLVRHGYPAIRLAELAREFRVDQVFTGRQGRSRMAALIFGSVSRELVRSCPVPITVVPYSLLEEPSRPESEIETSGTR